MTGPRILALFAAVFIAAWTSMPAAGSPLPESPTLPATASSVHTVRTGDTLWTIARQHATSPKALADANGLADQNRLRVGARITILGSSPGREAISGRNAGRARRPGMDWPSRGVVTSRFGYRGKRHHHGIDVAAPVGSPIAAARDGVVQFTGWQAGYGWLVIVDHGESLTTWYGHASKILVRVGQQVSKGKVIALVGTSGEVTGPNLHFEVRRLNVPLDPWPYLTGGRN